MIRNWSQAIWALSTGYTLKALSAVGDLWNWLQQPVQNERRIDQAVKCIAYLVVGITLTQYFGWKSMELEKANLSASRQANWLSAKQICYGNLSMNLLSLLI